MGRILLSICAVVVAGGLTGLSQQPKAPSEANRTTQSSSQADQAPTDRPDALSATQNGEGGEGDSTEKEERAEDDLKAQQTMADWAVVIGIFTGTQVLIGIAGTIALLITLNLNRASNQIALQTFEAGARPWLVFSEFRCSPVSEASPTEVVVAHIIDVGWKNEGGGPAIEVRSALELRLIKAGGPVPQFEKAVGGDVFVAGRGQTMFTEDCPRSSRSTVGECEKRQL